MPIWRTEKSGGIWCASPYLVHFLSVISPKLICVTPIMPYLCLIIITNVRATVGWRVKSENKKKWWKNGQKRSKICTIASMTWKWSSATTICDPMRRLLLQGHVQGVNGLWYPEKMIQKFVKFSCKSAIHEKVFDTNNFSDFILSKLLYFSPLKFKPIW